MEADDATDSPKRKDEITAERQIEGVDLESQTVTLPEDVAKAFEQEEDVYSNFQRMPFSNKREYIENIVSAENPETRQKRIEETIGMIKNNLKKDS